MKALSLKLISAVYIFIAGSLCMCAQDYLGTTEGELTTSQSGAAVYTIPIKLTDGYSSFTPQIALTYNSQAGSGIAGVGWDLSGLSAITSVPHSRYYDGDTISGVQISKNDAYALDGNRLLLMSGTNGCTGAEYDTEEKSYSKIYIEDEFTNTPKTFVVKRANGTTYKYGSTNNGVMRFPTSTSDNAFTWYLDYVEDKHGNYIKYIYNYFNNIPYLTEIRYGGNVRNANTSYCSVLFEYENKQDKQTINFKGVNIINDKRLKKITCKYYGETYREFTLTYDNSSYYSHLISVKESGTDGKSFPETTFEWNNLPNDDQYISDLISSSRQVSVATGLEDPDNTAFMSGDVDQDGKSELIGLTSHDEGLSSLRIYDYYPSGHFNLRMEYDLSGNFDLGGMKNFLSHQSYGQFGNLANKSIVVGEYSNMSGNDIVRFAFSNGFNISLPLKASDDIPFYSITDIDKDGSNDILYIEKGRFDHNHNITLEIIKDIDPVNNTYNTQSIEISLSLSNIPENKENTIKRTFVNDFDGDGLDDVLVVGNHCSIIVWADNGTYNNYNVLDSIYFNEAEGFYTDKIQIADINGDGLIDLLIQNHITYYNVSNPNEYITLDRPLIWKKALNTGLRNSSLFNLQEIDELNNLNLASSIYYHNAGYDEYDYCIPTDINYDGLSDFIIGHYYKRTSTQYIVQSNRDGTMSVIDSRTCNTNNHTLCIPKCNGIIMDDFDGDGTAEILEYVKGMDEYGYDDPKWTLYTYPNIVPSSNKIVSITNGWGKKTDITYNAYSDDNIENDNLLLKTQTTGLNGNIVDVTYYNSQPGHNGEYNNHMMYVEEKTTITNEHPTRTYVIGSFQLRKNLFINETNNIVSVASFNSPISVASQLTTSYNSKSYTTYIRYSGAKYHLGGKGFLGFHSIIKEQDGTKNKTITEINPDYFVPYISQVQSISMDGDVITNNNYNYNFINEGNNQYISQLGSEYFDDYVNFKYGTITYSDYNAINGKPQKIVSGNPENGIETTVTTTYQDVTTEGKWLLGLPTKIETEYKTITGFDSDDYEEDTYCTIENNIYDSKYNLKSTMNRIKCGYSSKTVNYNEYTYGINGKITKIINRPYNKPEYKTTTQNVYNNLGQLTQTVNIDGQKINYVYDKYGRIVKTSDMRNRTDSKYTYNGFGQEVLRVLSSQNNEFNPDTVYTDYIKEGNNYAIRTSGSNIPTSIEYYDGFGRNYASGSIHFDGKEFITERRFFNLVLVEFESLPHEKGTNTDVGTTYQYDSFLRPVLITDPQGKKTSFVYHNGGKTVTEDSISTTYDYDADGRLFMKVDDRDNWIFYSYKASGEYDKITIDYEGTTDDTKVVTFEYDDYGRLLKRTNANNNVERYEYDEIGRVKSVSRDGKTESYTYNLYGNVTSKTNIGQGPYSNVTTEYTYNSNQKLIKSQNPHKISTFKYNRHGDLVSTCDTIIDNKYTSRTYSIKTDYIYNNRNQLESKEITLGGVNRKLIESYGYNNGLLTSVMFNNKLMHQLEQEDVFGREIQNSDELFTNKYTYNNNGQLLTKKKYYRNYGNNTSLAFQHLYEYNDLGLLIQKDNNIYEYDSYNRLSRYNNQTYSYDDKGNLTIDGAQGNISYNNYQIQSVSSPTPDVWGTSELSILNNGYNQPYMIAQDRTMMILDYDCDWNRYVLAKYSNVTPTDYLNYCNDISVPQKSYDYARIYCNSQYEIYDDHTNSLTHFYYIGGDPLSAYAVAKVRNDEIDIMYLYRDDQGSITEIVDSTHYIKHIQYSPWGCVCDENGVPYPNGYLSNDAFIRGFLGQEYYSEFGLVNLNARLYNPYTGRFLSPDPVFDPEGNAYGFNPYIYGNNNPCTFVDPDGRVAWVPIIFAVACAGGLNVCMNMDNIHTCWDGLLSFGVGAGAGAVGVMLYPLGIAAFGSGALGVACAGAISGGISSAFGVGLDGLVTGRAASWSSLASGFVAGAISGAAFSVGVHAINCVGENLNFFTGEPKPLKMVDFDLPQRISSIAETERPVCKFETDLSKVKYPDPYYIQGTREAVYLNEGTILDRYANNIGACKGGTFMGLPGEGYYERSIPAPITSKHYYEIKLLEGQWVEKSIAAPFPEYNLPGGANQFQFLDYNKYINTGQWEYYNLKQMFEQGKIEIIEHIITKGHNSYNHSINTYRMGTR